MANLDPEYFYVPFASGTIDIQVGIPSAAISALRKVASMEAPPFVTAWLGYAYAASGDRVRELAIIETLKNTRCTACCAVESGRRLSGAARSRARPDLSGAGLHRRFAMATSLRSDRIFDPLRKEPRFIAPLDKLGFKRNAS
ncbi:MAG: hypothetical protein JSR65_11140 [Proteobacteria bacterium]|nr:hypothetical protein [Pseudomonadota bacterium]